MSEQDIKSLGSFIDQLLNPSQPPQPSQPISTEITSSGHRQLRIQKLRINRKRPKPKTNSNPSGNSESPMKGRVPSGHIARETSGRGIVSTAPTNVGSDILMKKWLALVEKKKHARGRDRVLVAKEMSIEDFGEALAGSGTSLSEVR